MRLLTVWFQFLVLTALIVYAGINLARYGDYIAAHTKLGRIWVGVLLLAVATSLPELINGISASLRSLPDIAIGNVLGACVLNLLQIAIIDIYYRPSPVLNRADKGHLISAGFGVFTLFIVGYSLVAAKLGFSLNLLNIGIYTPIIIISYLLAIRYVFIFEQKKVAREIKEVAKPMKIKLSTAYSIFALFALMIIIAGAFLPAVGAQIAKLSGWNQSFVGTLFIAISTSLPELSVSISAIAIGAIDLALGNILGSNLFNVFVIAIDDFFFTGQAILSAASSTNLLTVMAAIAMYSVVMINIVHESRVKKLRVTSTVVSLLAIFLLNTYLVFRA